MYYTDDIITIPAGKTNFSFNFSIKCYVVQGEETFSLVIDKNMSSCGLLAAIPYITSITIVESM